MKMLQRLVIILFIAVLVIPLVRFNFTPDTISLIDNRKLAENPFTVSGDLTKNIENYVNDRLGFRDTLIKNYTILNDRLFSKMDHPTYVYGQDRYVFGQGLTVYDMFSHYHIVFADMVKKIQTYCESRGVPFLFVFNPAKPAIYSDKIAKGYNYNRSWVPLFLAELDARGINYLDNTETLLQLRASGTDGFNKQYDAGHWNDIGAYYGTNAMLERLHESLPSVYVIPEEELVVSEVLQTTLPVSEFPIHEYVPSVWLPSNAAYTAGEYSTISIDPGHNYFGSYTHEQRLNEGAPRALVFQGSYMNGYGFKYLIHSFSEYIAVHDYQNVLNFPYYFNIFQPECVIFEVAEYTFSDTYFDYERMQNLQYNPAFSPESEDHNYTPITLSENDISVVTNDALTTIRWVPEQTYRYVWLELNEVYDMQWIDGAYEATVDTARYEQFTGQMTLYVTNSVE